MAAGMSDLISKVVVAGAGPAGLVAACLLAQAGIDTICVAPVAAADPRTVALLSPSLKLLESIALWTDDFRQHCAPLKQLHLLDDTGNLVSAPNVRFSASEANLDAFGWNIPLAVLVPALRAKAADFGVRFVDDEVARFDVQDAGVEVQTCSCQSISANFAVAADGRNSILRKAAGISASDWSVNQSALVTRFSHSRDHEGVSTEWHKLGGPFTTVPLPGLRSALVWMDKPAKIQALMQLSLKELAREIQLQNHGTLGLISNVATPHSFPMRGVKAKCFAAKRTYLVGEAAHVFPPVGAQGLNMSLRDAGHMVDVVLGHEDAGSNKAPPTRCVAPTVWHISDEPITACRRYATTPGAGCGACCCGNASAASQTRDTRGAQSFGRVAVCDARLTRKKTRSFRNRDFCPAGDPFYNLSVRCSGGGHELHRIKCSCTFAHLEVKLRARY
jgi:2-octaprenyl-6-methoxyphenol hydroxylase